MALPANATPMSLSVSGWSDPLTLCPYSFTGDSDLLVLHPFRGIIVVSPAALLTLA
jgi:hypothetical protein